MKRRSRKRNLFHNIPVILLMLFMLLSALPLTTLNLVRADTYISGRTGSIQAILMSQADSSGRQTPYPNVSMKLYQIGNVNENDGKVSFTLDLRFAAAGIKPETLTTADKWAAAARTLAEMVSSSGINFIEGTSDAQGQIFFDNLQQGIYLLVQSSAQDWLEISPSLLTVPLQENGQWLYDIKTYPKFSPDHVKADISVTKRLYSVNENSQVVPLTAEHATFKVGLYTDKEGTIPFRDDCVKEINIRDAMSGTAVWKEVPTGSYYIFELDEKGNPFPIGQKIDIDEENSWMYNVKDESENENNQVIVSSSGSSGNMYVDNYFYYLPHGYYPNCTVTPIAAPTTVPPSNNSYLKSGTSVTVHQTSGTNIKTVKTGDDTQVLPWIVILAVAAAGIVIVYKIKRKNK